MRCGVHWGEGRGHDDDLDLVADSLCDVRRRRQQDARSCGGSGDGRGGGSPTFGVGKVGRRPLHSVVRLTNRVGKIDEALWVFSGWNRIANNDDTEDAQKEESRGGVGGGYRAQHMTIRKTLLGRAIFFASFLYDLK